MNNQDVAVSVRFRDSYNRGLYGVLQGFGSRTPGLEAQRTPWTDDIENMSEDGRRFSNDLQAALRKVQKELDSGE